MIEPRHLPNAPIKEALIDFSVTLPQAVGLDALEDLYVSVTKDYPTKKTLHHSQIGLHLEKDLAPRPTLDHNVIGYRYESADGARIAQFRTNGFTFSMLEPCTTWEEMRDEARRLWAVYVEAVSPEVTTRIATRFINLLRIPLPFNSFEEFLTAPPRLPENLPQQLVSFLSRVVISEPSINAIGIITQALENAEADHAPVVLDIDAFINRPFDAIDGGVWDYLEQLRTFKNTIFFNRITENTEALCK